MDQQTNTTPAPTTVRVRERRRRRRHWSKIRKWAMIGALEVGGTAALYLLWRMLAT
jgi:hypothetical protein